MDEKGTREKASPVSGMTKIEYEIFCAEWERWRNVILSRMGKKPC